MIRTSATCSRRGGNQCPRLETTKLISREVLEVLPIPPIALGLRTAVAMVSYADSFVFGITADYDTAPDIDRLAAGIERGVARLVGVTPMRRRKHQCVKKIQSA